MKTQFLQPLGFAAKFIQVGRPLVNLLKASLAFLQFAKPLQERLKRVAARFLKQFAEKVVVVRRARRDFAIRLGRPKEFADVGVFRLAAEKARPDGVGIVVDVSVVLAARQVRDTALELRLRRGAEASALLDGERKIYDRNGRNATPAFEGDVHAVRRKPDSKRNSAPSIRLQLHRSVGDARLAHGTSGDGVVAKHDALDGASAGILRARNACGRVELHLAPGGQNQVDCVKDRCLARAVVAQKKQMPAFGNLDGRRAEVMELDNPHGGDSIVLTWLHDALSSSTATG